MDFLKPILIAVLIILAVLIIVKANRFSTAEQPPKETAKKNEPQQPAGSTPPKKPVQVPVEFFIVYAGRRVPVSHYPFTIGSRNDNDLMIQDSTVSRRHAELFRKNGQVCLRDLGSLNGTIVNKVPRAETAIVGGERIQLGTTVLQVERALEEAPDDTQFI